MRELLQNALHTVFLVGITPAHAGITYLVLVFQYFDLFDLIVAEEDIVLPVVDR